MLPYAFGLPSSTQASFTRYRVGKLSVPSTMTSYGSNSFSAFSDVSAVSYVSMLTFGFSALRRSFADASFGRPTSGVPCRICRCRLLKSTVSKSTMPSVPTPAAARYMATGDPSPPAPMHNTLAAFNFS